jgi:hypothetical protein
MATETRADPPSIRGGTLLLLRKFCPHLMVLGIGAEPVGYFHDRLTVRPDREHARLYLHVMPQTRGT